LPEKVLRKALEEALEEEAIEVPKQPREREAADWQDTSSLHRDDSSHGKRSGKADT